MKFKKIELNLFKLLIKKLLNTLYVYLTLK